MLAGPCNPPNPLTLPWTRACCILGVGGALLTKTSISSHCSFPTGPWCGLSSIVCKSGCLADMCDTGSRRCVMTPMCRPTPFSGMPLPFSLSWAPLSISWVANSHKRVQVHGSSLAVLSSGWWANYFRWTKHTNKSMKIESTPSSRKIEDGKAFGAGVLICYVSRLCLSLKICSRPGMGGPSAMVVCNLVLGAGGAR